MNRKEILDFLANTLAEKITPSDVEMQNVIDAIAAIDDEAERKEVMDKFASLETTNAELVEKFNEMQNKLTEITNKQKPSTKMDKAKEMQDKLRAIEKAVINKVFTDPTATLKDTLKREIINAGLNAGEFVPSAFFPEVQDNLSREETFLNRLRYLGKRAITIPTAMLGIATNDVAGGHKKGQSKVIQSAILKAKEIKLGTVYKLTEVPYEDRRDWAESGADLMAWVMDELYQNIINKIEECVLVGDKTGLSDRKVESFKSVLEDTTDYTAVVPAAAQAEGFATREEVRKAADAIAAQGKRVAFMSKEQLSKLAEFKYTADGTATFTSKEETAAMLGLDEIITREFVNGDNGAFVIIVCLEQYGYAGDNVPTKIEAYDIKTNQHDIEMLTRAGGGLIKAHSAAVVKPAEVA